MLGRIKSIFKAKANSIINDIENPEEAIDLSLVELKQKVGDMKQALLEVMTIKKKLEEEIEVNQDEILLTDEQAALAIQASREDLARKALEKKQMLVSQTGSKRAELKQIQEKIHLISVSKEQLEKRVIELESKQRELKSLNKVADAELMVKEVLTGLSSEMTDMTERIERAENKIDEKHARILAIDELEKTGMLNHGSHKASYEIELEELQRQSKVQEELAALKIRVNKEETR